MITNKITVVRRSNTDLWLNWRTMQDTTVTGLSKPISDKVQEGKSGPMDRCTKVGGKIIKLMELVDSSMLMVMFMMDSG